MLALACPSVWNGGTTRELSKFELSITLFEIVDHFKVVVAY
jgi:hypothetical protein